MDTTIGFGGAKFNQGTFGKGVMVGHGSPVSTSTVNTFGIAHWESTHAEVSSSSTVLMFGGLLKGGTSYMQGTGTIYSSPVFQWAGFGVETVQGTTLTFGYISWDGQTVSSTTWTTFQVD
tara:strand:- start:347 stop:706 length:360 start_codon:yes stop_codon:yes gene_type:complete